MNRQLNIILAVGLLAASLGGCGHGDGDAGEAKKNDPAPVSSEDSSDSFLLQGGTYYVEQVRNLQDGCGKKPLDDSDSITQVPFFLTNDGKGNVSIDFCSDQGKSVSGVVRGNKGTLYALHNGRHMGSDDYPAVMDQECRIDLKVKADNTMDGQYTETQRNRNAALREATVDVPECTTSFAFTMTSK